MTFRLSRFPVRSSGGPVVNALTVNPFVSEAQRRACYAADDPAWDCVAWERHGKKRRRVSNARGRRNRVSRIDPTRSVTMRRAFAAKLRRQWGRLRGEIVKLVVADDAFGLKGSGVGRHAFNAYDPDQPRDEQGRWASSGGVGEHPPAPGGKVRQLVSETTAEQAELLLSQGVRPDFKRERVVEEFAPGAGLERGGLYVAEERAFSKGSFGKVRLHLSVGEDGLDVPQEMKQLGYAKGKEVAGEQSLDYVLKTENGGVTVGDLPPSVFTKVEVYEGGKWKEVSPKEFLAGRGADNVPRLPSMSQYEKVLRERAGELHLQERHIQQSLTDYNRGGLQDKLFLAQDLGLIANAFCATGEGGGVDPSCSPNGGGQPSVQEMQRLSDLSREDLKDNPQKLMEYREDLGHRNVIAYWDDNAQKMYVGDSFFEHSAEDRLDMVAHEIGHGLVSKYSKDPDLSQEVFFPLVETGVLGKWNDEKGRFVGFSGQRNPDEALADLAKDYLLRPDQLAKYRPKQFEAIKSLLTRNAFCPTGPGGGVDPSCSPGQPSLAARVRDKIAARYGKLKERYGKAGAIAVLSATAALIAAPIPGTALLPLAVAEGIRLVVRGLTSNEQALLNVFCPTGEGGGIDPTCSPQGVTDSQEFKEWFAGSKVTDAAGKPLKVYHGTSVAFDEFSDEAMKTRGHWFTSDPTLADSYATGESANVRPVYLSIKNPRPVGGPVMSLEEMKRAGYDGFISPSGKLFAAFSSKQIKSAITGNEAAGMTDADVQTAARELLEELSAELVDNAFCPTGEGGGIDPSCSPGTIAAYRRADELAAKHGEPIPAKGDIKAAAVLISQGKRVELEQPEQLSTLVNRLGKMAARAEELGHKAPKMDLCNVSVPGTNLFCQETKGIPRVQMPQMRGQPVEGSYAAGKEPVNKEGKVDVSAEFINHLREQDIKVTEASIRGSRLRASQAEIDGARVAELMGKARAGKDLRERPIFVTRDNYVLDGHHHWAAIVAEGAGRGKDLKIPVYKLDMDIGRGVHEANAFAKAVGIAPKSVDPAANMITANAQQFAFASDPRSRMASMPEKVAAFQRWLRRQLGALVTGKTQEQLWQAYVDAGFRKGAARSYDDYMRGHPEVKRENLDFYRGGREGFLRDSFRQPESVEKVKLMAGRTFDDLENVTREMSTRMSRALTDGLVQGKHPLEIARELNRVADLGEARSELIARTEMIRAHAEGQLQALEDLGVAEVGVQVEWATAGDDEVCPECAGMEGAVFAIDDAHGKIPAHPNCRCAFLPAGAPLLTE